MQHCSTLAAPPPDRRDCLPGAAVNLPEDPAAQRMGLWAYFESGTEVEWNVCCWWGHDMIVIVIVIVFVGFHAIQPWLIGGSRPTCTATE